MTTIPTEAERAAERARKMKRVGDLERGDWFRPDFADFVSAACVRHVEPYRSDAWGNGVVLLYRPVGEQGADSHRLSADDQVPMLTEGEIDQAMDVDRRELIAEQLADVIRLVRDPAFPLPAIWQAVKVEVTYADSVSVAKLARLLGVDLRETDVQVYAQRDGNDDWCAGVDLVGSAFKPADPDPTGQLYSREADDPTPVSGVRGGELHHGAMTDGGLVDETGCTHGVTTCRCADADTVPVPAEDATLTQPRGIDPDASMEAHYDAEAETGIFSPARRQELLWKRAVGERGGEAEALEHAHELALYEDNDRARQAVVLGLRSGEAGRIVNPSLARLLAEKEHAKRYPTHLVFVVGDTACGIEPEEIPATDRRTSDADAVTCPACRRVLKPSAKDVYA